MSNPPTIQTNPLDPVFSGVPTVFPQTGMVNPTWNKWFVDLREKVNVINDVLAAIGGTSTPIQAFNSISPLIAPGDLLGYDNGTNIRVPGSSTNGWVLTYDSTVTGKVKWALGGGGGSPMHITNAYGNYTIISSDVPNTSSYVGMIIATSASANIITIDLNANTSIPVGAIIYVMQNGSGETKITGVPGTSIYGPSITGAGKYALGKAIQTSLDSWYISGELSYIPVGSDPYWANVVTLLHFDGSDGSTVINDEVLGNVWTASGNAEISTANSKFGGSSLNNNGVGGGTVDISTITPLQIAAGQDFTIEFFLYPVSGSKFFDTYSGTTGSNLIFRWISGDLSVYSVGTTRSTGLAIPANTWSFITLVRQSGTITPYVNGVAGTSWSYTGAYAFSRYALLLDVYGHVAFNGYMDELRQTNGVARYTSNFTPPTSPFPNL